MRSPSPPAILIVDDEPDSIKLLQLNLKARGCETLTAGDGAEALKVFGERHIDLVLLDLMLPGMDGLQVCRKLRASSNSVRIIVVSARAMDRDKAMALNAGADDYIAKPFGIGDLIERLYRALEYSQKTRVHP